MTCCFSFSLEMEFNMFLFFSVCLLKERKNNSNKQSCQVLSKTGAAAAAATEAVLTTTNSHILSMYGFIPFMKCCWQLDLKNV